MEIKSNYTEQEKALYSTVDRIIDIIEEEKHWIDTDEELNEFIQQEVQKEVSNYKLAKKIALLVSESGNFGAYDMIALEPQEGYNCRSLEDVFKATASIILEEYVKSSIIFKHGKVTLM